MNLRSLSEIAGTDERVLLRVDYNVDLELLKKTDEHFKISASKKTVEALLGKKAKIALLSHIGEPQGKDPALSSLRLVSAVEKALQRKVRFIPDCLGETVQEGLETLPFGEILLLENVRYYPEEEKNDREFAKKLSEPFSAYVNESFGVDHRSHASLTSVVKYLPSYAGFRLLEEIERLDQIRLRPEHPAVAIIGGAKIETKLPLIQALELNYDAILVGGKIANEALDRAESFTEKVFLPVDFDSPNRFDIGPRTIERYKKIILGAKTIIWNGPLGKFEEAAYAKGTQAILEAVLQSSAFTVMGGGESLDILEKSQSHGNINFVSTGGGAMLEYLSGKRLPALVALENSQSA